MPFSGRALEILHDARKRSARDGRTEAPSSRAAAQDVVAHTWPEATADDDNRQRVGIAALDTDSARVTVDDTIAFYDTATARERDRRGAPKQNATCVSTETTVERAGSHDQEDDADRPLSVEARSCSTKYSRTAHRPSKPLQKPREFRDESAHGPLRVERLGDPFAFLNLGVTGTRLYKTDGRCRLSTQDTFVTRSVSLCT